MLDEFDNNSKTLATAAQEAELGHIVLRCTQRALERWLRVIPLQMRIDIYCGFPRSILLKLRACMSERSWNELLKSWKLGLASPELKEKGVKQALLYFNFLISSGELYYEGTESTIDVGVPMKMEAHPVTLWDRVRNEIQMVGPAARASQEWLRRELPEYESHSS